jgi:hypothetical protein
MKLIEHLGRSMSVGTMEADKTTLRRRYIVQLSIAAWRGYANLILDMTKYVGNRQTCANMAQIMQEMIGRAYVGAHVGVFMAHATNAPFRDSFSRGWGEYGVGASSNTTWGDALH